MKQQAISVSDLNRYAKQAIQQMDFLQNLVVCGEIAGFTKHYKSGHCYFTLRDSRSSIKSVMFARQASLLGFQPQDGMEVVVYGRADLFERDGAFQLYVEYMRPSGVGSVQKAFDQLKEKLEREGLFDPKYKKPLPPIPHTVGVVTSKTGAALQDILNVMGRRWPEVKLLLAPVSVQGQTAEEEVVRGIRALERDGRSQVILVARGGGSREDLWVFNSERIARAAFACTIPLVSAVGHEIDYTILDYVADLRAPTPSAAAELCVPDREEWLQKIQDVTKNIQISIQKKLELCYNDWRALSPAKAREMNQIRLARNQELLSRLVEEFRQGTHDRLAEGENALSGCAALAHSLDPYAVLARGYAVVESQGKVLPVEELQPGQQVTLVGQTARARCLVEEVTKGEVSV